MSLTSRKVLSAEVTLTGLGDDPDGSDVAAQVEFRAHGRPEQPRDLAGFLAMTVVATLRGCRSAPTHAGPFLDICGELANALLQWNPDSGGRFSLREAISEPLLDNESLMLIYGGATAPSEEMIDSWLRQCLPEVREQRTGGHRRRFKASLVEPRRAGGSAFVAMSNRNRNSFLEVEGTLAMFEAVAQTRDYGTTTRPAAATLRRLLDFNADVFGENIPGFGEATWLYELAASVSAAEDPLTAPLPSFSGTDGSGDQAVAMAKMGKWARESGLDNAAAATELLRRQEAGEPMPWEPQGS